MININGWVREKLAVNNNDKDIVYGMYSQIVADNDGQPVNFETFGAAIRRQHNIIFDESVIENRNIQLEKGMLKISDLQRIQRKEFRNYIRLENAEEEYAMELAKLLKTFDLSQHVNKHDVDVDGEYGIIHLTDLHFNELVNLTSNKYDYNIACKRLKKLADNAKRTFKSYNVKHVLVAMTGDLINNDSIADKLLNNATNRSKATLMAVHILKSFILDINQDFNVSVTGITGNESRVSGDIGFSEKIASHNYDFTILEMLRYLFLDSDGVNVFNCGYNEGVVNVGEKHILLMHGHTTRVAGIEKFIQQLRGRYASQGIMIDYVLFGHFHSCSISGIFARGASLVGANDYSEYGLNLDSRASQNIGIITKDSINMMMVDLQNTDGIEGYDIVKILEDYNPKSFDKLVRYDKVYKL